METALFRILTAAILVVSWLVSLGSAAVEINEIMYAPNEAWGGRYNEWIELFNSGSEPVNLSSCHLNGKLFSFSQLDTLLPNSMLQPSFYFIIASKANLFRQVYFNSTLNSTLFHLTNQINTTATNITIIEHSLSLNNGGDVVELNGSCGASIVNYSASVGGSKNNKTLERREDGTLGESLVAGGTPGMRNSLAPDHSGPNPTNSSTNLSTNHSANSSNLSLSLWITEFLPNPEGADDADKPSGEWIELHNHGNTIIDLQGFFFLDEDGGTLWITDTNVAHANDTLLCPECFLTIYRDGDSDFSLDNGQDHIYLWKNEGDGLPIAQVSYSGSKEGLSWNLVDGQWQTASPTPGTAFVTENTAEDSCDAAISIHGEPKIDSINSTNLPFSVTVLSEKSSPFSSFNVTVRGKIETLSGSIVKEYSPWSEDALSTVLSKDYSPRLSDGTYLVSFWIENQSCSDSSLSNNLAKMIFVKRSLIAEESPAINSTISLESMNLGSDKKVKWGDQFTIKLKIYKGNESKKELKAWVERDGEKLSKATSSLLEEKYHDYSLTLPLLLEPNCNGKYNDGEVLVVVKAFGLSAEKQILVEGHSSDWCLETTAAAGHSPLSLSSSSSSTSSSSSSGSSSSSKMVSQSRSASLSVEAPASANAGEAIHAAAHLFGLAEAKTYSLSGYVYKGNACYSCSNSTRARDEDAISVTRPKYSEKTLNLLLKIDPSTPEGKYKLKAKLAIEGQKTPKEAITEIYVLPAATSKSDAAVRPANTSLAFLPVAASSSFPEESIAAPSAIGGLPSSKTVPLGDGIVIYESSSTRSGKMISYVLIAALILVVIALAIAPRHSFFRKA